MAGSVEVRRTYGVEEFLSAGTLAHADAVIAEVFAMMFSLDVRAADEASFEGPAVEEDERTAFLGFSGAMRGVCQIRMGCAGARLIVSAMLGGAAVEEADDHSVNDAIGEVCNMVAGGWKNSIPELSGACTLSPPTVISGQNYRVHVRKPSVKVARSYRFGGHAIHLAIHYEDAEAGRLEEA